MTDYIVSPSDTSCLDSQLTITFCCEADEAIFLPRNSQELIDFLVETDEQKANDLLSGDFDNNEALDTEDNVEFLKEAILGYLDHSIEMNDCPSALSYYTKLKSFLESSDIDSIEFELEASDEDDEDFSEEDEEILDECLNEFKDLFIDNSQKNISESVLGLIDSMSVIQEVSYKRVVRHGQVKELINCPPGFKSVDGKCVKMQFTEIRKRAKAAIKAVKTKKKHMKNMTFVKALEKKRAKSLKMRQSRGL